MILNYLNEKAIHDSGPEGETFCVMVAIGQKCSTVAQFVKVLEERGAVPRLLDHRGCHRVDLAPMQFLALFTACTMGDSVDNGQHALIGYDYLSKQAVADPPDVAAAAPPARLRAYPADEVHFNSPARARRAYWMNGWLARHRLRRRSRRAGQ